MADINRNNADLPIALIGQTTAGVPTTPVGSDISGNLLVNVAKIPLTPSAPTAFTVGVASAQALASNINRKGLTLVNTSKNTIYLGLGATAVIGSGIALYPGGSWVMDAYTYTTVAIDAIASAASSNLAIQELTT